MLESGREREKGRADPSVTLALVQSGSQVGSNVWAPQPVPLHLPFRSVLRQGLCPHGKARGYWKESLVLFSSSLLFSLFTPCFVSLYFSFLIFSFSSSLCEFVLKGLTERLFYRSCLFNNLHLNPHHLFTGKRNVLEAIYKCQFVCH